MKILVAEDSVLQRQLIVKLLEGWNHEVVIAKDGDTAWEILQEADAPRIVILDWMMPGLDGIEICHKLRERPTTRYLYTILLTAKSDHPSLVEALENGADDFLAKPFDPAELRARLSTATRILHLEEQLLSVATRDALTGLQNRGAIISTLKDELSRARRTGFPVGILMIDVDHFKRVNDLHGHIVGDAVLVQVARKLMATVRKYDGVGRYGGEEFLIILPECDEATTASLAERIRRTIKKGWDSGLTLPKVTLSIGTTVSTTQEDVIEVLRIADDALYRAKQTGRDKVEIGSARENPPIGYPSRVEALD